MKNTILLILMFLVAFNFLAQNANPSKSIIYSLKQNEILSYNEAILKTNANGKNYALIIKDTINNQESYIYNGKKIIEIPNVDIDGNFMTLTQINLSKTNSYIVEYSINNKQYININGTNYGPYEEIIAMGCKETEEYGFIYKLGSKYYLKFKDEKYGPFFEYHNDIFFADSKKTISNLYISFPDLTPYTAVISGTDYIEIVDSKFIYINGVEQNYSQDFQSIESLYFISKTNFGFAARMKDALDFTVKAIVVNGIVKSSFFYPDDYHGFMLTEKDLYVLSRNDITKNTVVLHSNVNRVLSFDGKGNFLFESKDKKVFFNNQLILNEPNVSIVNGLISLTGLEYSFLYSKNDKYYVRTKKDDFGPYDYVEDLCYDYSGNLKFNFTKDNVKYKFNSGLINEDLGSVNFYDIFYNYDNNQSLKFKNHFFESSYKYDFVVIDGDSFGVSPALQSWIEPSTSSFKWTALENNEYVLYTYLIK